MKASRFVIGAAVLAWSIAASAAPTITVTWDTPIVQPAGISTGTITYPGGSVSANVGRFVGTAMSWTDIDPETFYASGDDFYAYCHDLAQTLSNGANVVYDVTFGANEKILDFLGAVNAYFGGDAYRWLVPTSSTEAGAIQLGIWEGLHFDDFNLTTGGVRFASVSASVTNMFNAIVALMPNAPDLSAELVMVLASSTRQDVITGYRPPPRLFQVPEPGTLLLLALAGAAWGLLRRRA